MHFWSTFIFTLLIFTTMVAMVTSKPLVGNQEGQNNLGKQLQMNLYRQQQRQINIVRSKRQAFPRTLAVIGVPRQLCKFVTRTICVKEVCKQVVVTSLKVCESVMYQRNSATSRKRIMGRK